MHVLCPHCHTGFETVELAQGQEIACPSCGSGFQVELGSTTGWERQAHEKLGKFDLLDLVGQGAFGSVYRARDPELDRTVALKVPRSGRLPGPQERERFLREARAAAQLRHPSIVSIHEVGEVDGVPYLVSDFVEGVTLTDVLSARRPGMREAVELIAAIADALQFAHERGVVHRDIKPSNVMVDSEGKPHVMDFGLARRDAGEDTMTVEGQILGTPAYMPPEQARGEGHAVDARGDVYSLGVVLYQALTGELPFRGTTRMLLHQVLHDEPRPPRSLNDQIPRDLDTICLKALSKEPARRYSSAGELADDLRRYLEGRPIQARPVGRLERLTRWCRRNPVVAGLSMAFVLALVLGMTASLIFAYQARSREQQALQEQRRADGKAAEARRNLYTAHMRLAQSAWEDGHPETAERLLERQKPAPDEEDLRGWEWHYQNRLLQGGERVLSLDQEFSVYCLAFSPDGGMLAAGGFGRIALLDVASGREVHRIQGESIRGSRLAFSPDGKRLASLTSEKSARVWEVATGKEVLTLTGHLAQVEVVAFSPDGQHLFTGGNDRTARCWDAQTGKQVRIAQGFFLPGYHANVVDLSVRPDGRQLATLTYDGTIRIRDLASGRILRTLDTAPARASRLTYSPDGRLLATTGAFDSVKTWDVTQAKELTTHRSPVVTALNERAVYGCAFSPDGRMLLTGGATGNVYFTQGSESWTLRGHHLGVRGVAFSPDGSRMATGDYSGRIRLWSAAHPPEGRRLALGLALWKMSLPRGDRLVCSGGWLLQVRDPVNGRKLLQVDGGYQDAVPGASSLDGKWLVLHTGRKSLTVHDADSGKAVRVLEESLPVRSFAFRPGGPTLAVVRQDGAVAFWNVEQGVLEKTLEGRAVPVVSVDFSRDGSRMLLVGEDRSLTVEHPGAPSVIMGIVLRDEHPYQQVGISPCGKHVAAIQDGATLQVFDASSGELRHRLRYSTMPTTCFAFSPDGKRIATGDRHRKVRIWDVATGEELRVLRDFHDVVVSLAFHPDGHRLYVGTGARMDITLFDARPLDEDLRVEQEARSLVEHLLALPLNWSDLVEWVKGDPSREERVQRRASSLGYDYREEEDPEKYLEASLARSHRPNLGPVQARFAVAQARAACRMLPERIRPRIALGAAEYRAGAHRRALEVLTEAEPRDPDDPTLLGFLAMAARKGENRALAEATLARLKKVAASATWQKNDEVQALLAEAEGQMQER